MRLGPRGLRGAARQRVDGGRVGVPTLGCRCGGALGAVAPAVGVAGGGEDGTRRDGGGLPAGLEQVGAVPPGVYGGPGGGGGRLRGS